VIPAFYGNQTESEKKQAETRSRNRAQEEPLSSPAQNRSGKLAQDEEAQVEPRPLIRQSFQSSQPESLHADRDHRPRDEFHPV
jgi:hypothetical protein